MAKNVSSYSSIRHPCAQDTYGNPIYRLGGYTVFDRIVKRQTQKTQRLGVHSGIYRNFRQKL